MTALSKIESIMAPALTRGPAPQPSAPAGVTPNGAFDTLCDLIKQVFNVRSVTISLTGETPVAEPGVFRSFLDAPLVQDGKRIGTLRLLDGRERGFSYAERDMLDGFARMVVEQHSLWQMASRDALTGALSRRAFAEALDKAFSARSRNGQQATLVMFDLDHFKLVNDTHGHAAGDAVLKTVAEVVARELRTVDSFGRLGGEEFGIILDGADAMASEEVANRIRRAIARAVAPGFEQIAFTSSFGVAECTPDMLSTDDWMARADARLYAAKDAGRNRVCVAGKTPLKTQLH